MTKKKHEATLTLQRTLKLTPQHVSKLLSYQYQAETLQQYPEIRLWLAVIERAFSDLILPTEQANARRFLLDGGCEHICDKINLEFSAVEQFFSNFGVQS